MILSQIEGIALLKNTLIYSFSSIASAAIPFILLPVLTRYLTPAEYGQIAMFTIFTTALASVVGLSVQGAANRRFFDDNTSSLELAKFNGNCFFILLVSTSFALSFLFLVDTLLAEYLGIPSSWIYLGVISVFFSFVINIRLGQWQVRGKAKAYGILQITNAFIVLLLSLLFVISLQLGPDGRVYGIVLASAVIGTIAYRALHKDKLVLLKYCRTDINYALSFGLPLIPHVLGGFLLLSLDRLVINKELGLGMTGIYMVAVNLGSALNIIFNSINKAYVPWLFEQLKKADDKNKLSIVKKTYIYFMLLMIMAALSFLIAPPILEVIVGEEYREAANILPLILTGQVFMGMYYMVTNYIFYIKKTKYLSYVTISSGIINIILLLVLVPTYGISGAAFAFLIANMVRFIFTWAVSAYLYKMPWALRIVK